MDSRTVRALTVLGASLLVIIMMTFSLTLSACSSQQAATSAESATEAETSTEPEEDQAEASAPDQTQEELAADYNLEGTLTEPIEGPYASGIHHATIEVEGYGTIRVELNANNAPITVSNFAQLAEDSFYDGLTFHRIIEGFMIQGGDPNGDGTGGATRTIKGEFFSNGVRNNIQHKRGVISMARSSDNDSASSQFFIMHEDTSSLDEQYAAFGKVTEGMDVVDAIATSVPVEDSNGTVAPENQPRITSIRMDD